MSKRMTVSIDDGLYSMVRIKHSNMSKYVEELIKADTFKSQEQRIYDAIVHNLKRDGYIHEPSGLVGNITGITVDSVTQSPGYIMNDFQRAKANAALSEPTIVPDSQERW